MCNILLPLELRMRHGSPMVFGVRLGSCSKPLDLKHAFCWLKLIRLLFLKGGPRKDAYSQVQQHQIMRIYERNYNGMDLARKQVSSHAKECEENNAKGQRK